MLQKASTNFALMFVVQVVGVFPDVERQEDRERGAPVHVVLLDLHDERPVRHPAPAQHGPAGALGAHGRLGEFLLEPLEAAELLVDGRPQDARWFSAAALARRRQVLPEKAVQQVPADVEGQFPEGGLHVELASALPGLFELLEQRVGPGHVGLVVLFMVELQLLLRHKRRQFLVTVRQFW